MDESLSGETTAQAPKQTTKEYKSPPHALIWFFRKSRDLWKSKYQELQASIKRLKNRVADVTKSREQWELKAEQTLQFRRKPAVAGKRRLGVIGLGWVGQGFMQQAAQSCSTRDGGPCPPGSALAPCVPRA